MPDKSIAAFAPAAIISAFGDLPEVETTKQALINFERQVLSQRQRQSVDKPRRLPTSLHRSGVEQTGLIAPAIPTRLGFPPE